MPTGTSSTAEKNTSIALSAEATTNTTAPSTRCCSMMTLAASSN